MDHRFPPTLAILEAVWSAMWRPLRQVGRKIYWAAKGSPPHPDTRYHDGFFPPMTITDQHRLEGQDVRHSPIPGGSAMPTRRFLVIHYTEGGSASSSIDWWRELGSGVCAHVVIDRDGTIFQCRPFNRTCGHAGRSSWRCPKTGRLFTGLNTCAIGIELANGGSRYPERFSRLSPVRAAHKNGGPEREWERYNPAQLDACFHLAKLLARQYNLDDIVGHDDIAPDRKTDPGPAFPMGDLREFCGFPRAYHNSAPDTVRHELATHDSRP